MEKPISIAELIFITGGTRSGKSSYAQLLAEQKSDNPVYLATARIWDDDFKQRVERHQEERGSQWTTVEEAKDINVLNFSGKTVVLDCITLWLTNIFHDNEYDMEKSLSEAKAIWDRIIKQDFTLFVVSNELGMSIHPENEVSRKFTDLQGFMNQYIASLSNKVYLMVSGIAVEIKS